MRLLLPPRRADEDYRRILDRLRRGEQHDTRDWTIGRYYLAGPNSNTFPRYVADRCCARKVGLTVIAPGWGDRTPEKARP